MSRSALDPDRLARLRRHLDEAGAAALLVVGRSARDPDLAMLLGPVHLGECFAVLPGNGVPRVGYVTEMERDEAVATGLEPLTPAVLLPDRHPDGAVTAGERAARLWTNGLAACDIAPGRLALAGSYTAGALSDALAHLAAAGWETLDFHPVLRRLRKRKTADEHAEIERVAAATGTALRAVASTLASVTIDGEALRLEGRPLTVADLRRAIRDVFARAGVEQPEGNIVSAGCDAAVPHTQGADTRQLRAGEAIVVDLFPRGRLYADCTRTFCVGPAPDPLSRAHRLVREALEEATAGARVGALGETLQELVCARFEDAGWSTLRSHPAATRGYVHGLGHGVGFELHELPGFRGGSGETRLEAGDVFTLEPGLYDPEAGFGVRLEDLFRLEVDGPRCLTPLPYSLDPTAW